MHHDGTPSMRGVRDKYLDLLLTGGKAHPSTPAPPNPQPTWTPGKHIPAAQNMSNWTSPVTPAPTENDVRLAEIAAGLVAAGGAEQRHTETIRRLAEQLERSERKVRELEEGDRRRSRGRRRASVEHLGEEDWECEGDSRPKRETRKHLRFTPGKVPEEEDDFGFLQRAETMRRSSASRSAKKSPDKRVLLELQALRKEKESWKKERERSHEESEKLARMLADIRRNTQRLLSERGEHLAIIARLQDEINGQRRVTELFSACTGNSDERASPVPLFSERHSPSATPNIYQRENSPSSVRHVNFGNANEPYDQLGHHYTQGEHCESDRELGSQPSAREQELREELQLVLEENKKLCERIPLLEEECLELSRQLRQTELEQQARREHQEEIAKVDSASISTEEGIAVGLAELLDELDILEGVCEAFNFRVTPIEADRLQDSISTVNVTCPPNSAEQLLRARSISSVIVVRDATRRLMDIRSGLSIRYGQWLRSVAHDEDSSSIHISDPTRSDLDTALQETIHVDTEVIDNIIRDA